MEFNPDLKEILSEEEEVKDTEKNSVSGCNKCDAGYIENGKLCECLRFTIMKRKYANSNIDYEFASLEIIEDEMDARLKNGNGSIKISMNSFIDQYVNNAKNNLNTGFGILINGGTGRGKSLSAMKTIMKLVDKGYKCYFTTVKQFLDIIKKSWESDEYKNVLNYIYNCDFLVMDDIGVEYHREGSDWVLTEIDSLMRHRYFKKKPIIITTNSSVTNLKEKYAQRIVSLFHERLMFIAIISKEDYREKTAGIPEYLNLEDIEIE